MSEKLRVLIIDDDDMLRNALQSALACSCGWHVLTARDPSQAAAFYQQVDVVLSDWAMPFGGGERVLAESPKPVLVYSSEAAITHPYRIRKPATLDTIRDAIVQTFESAQPKAPR